MRRIWPVILFVAVLSGGADAFGQGPMIEVIDDSMSIHAESVPLDQLLRLVDQATGMTSQVPADLANRTISVQFTGLTFNDAVRKIFEGQPLDYVVVGGQGIIVTSMSLPRTNQQPAAFPSSPAFQLPVEPLQTDPFIHEEPGFAPDQPVMPGLLPGVVPGQFFGAAVPNQQPNQPAVIQTPFGPIPNPRANQPGQTDPMGMPQQVNPPGVTPLGTPQPNQNPLFGNTSPPILGAPGTTPLPQVTPLPTQ